MQHQSELSQVLIDLSQRVTKNNTTNKLQLLKLLLFGIDINFFKKSNCWDTIQQIYKIIVDYYSQVLHQKIRKHFFQGNQFINIYKLILDLALTFDRQHYLQQMLAMNDNDKQLLMPLVQEITQRKFIKNNQDQFQGYEETQKEYFEQKYKQIYKKYRQLEQNYNLLKQDYHKISQELLYYKNQKIQLMDKFGSKYQLLYQDVGEKYSKELQYFNKEVQILHKEIQDKNATIQQRNNQIKQLITNYRKLEGSCFHLKKDYQGKLENQIEQNNRLKIKMEELYSQINCFKQKIVENNQQNHQKDKVIAESAKIIEKYNMLKKLHFQFKDNIVKEYKEYKR